MTRRVAQRLRDQRGVVMIEFALVLPLLLLFTLGILSFGRYMNYTDQESQMAAQAARWASVAFDPPGSTTLQTYVGQQAMGGLQTASGDVTSAAKVYVYYPTPSGSCTTNGGAVVGCPIRACVVASVTPTSFLRVGAMRITESATMRIEKALTGSEGWTPDSLATVSTTTPCPTS